METPHDSEVLHSRKGAAGIAILNRPKALNALNTNMVVSLYRLYSAWLQDPTVQCLVLKGAGEKAFCAGGDVRSIAEQIQAGRGGEACTFFMEEYKLNYTIGQLSKPHVALMDGITMGGGVGVSVHGHIRVATERTLFAMPECGIGLFPDVGGSYFLPRLPDHLGMYLALSGTRLKGLEVKQAGVATHYVDSTLIPELENDICSLGPEAGSVAALERIINKYEAHSLADPDTALHHDWPVVSECFGAASLGGIYEALRRRGQGDAWAQRVLRLMARGSPLSQAITFEQLRRGGQLSSLRECLQMEARLARRFCVLASDFVEGVRATLVDKDNNAHWTYKSIDEVPPSAVDAFFARLPADEELQLAPPSAPASRL